MGTTLAQLADDLNGAPIDLRSMAERVVSLLDPKESDQARTLFVAAQSVIQGDDMFTDLLAEAGIELG